MFDSLQNKGKEQPVLRMSLAERLARLKARRSSETGEKDLLMDAGYTHPEPQVDTLLTSSIADARHTITLRDKARYAMLDQAEAVRTKQKNIFKAAKEEVEQKSVEDMNEEERRQYYRLEQFKKDLARDVDNENRVLLGKNETNFGSVAFSREKNIVTGPGGKKYTIRKEFFDQLFFFQKDGVNWLFNACHFSRLRGGILADEMGIGKTIQVCVFIDTLRQYNEGKKVLLVVPLTLVNVWKEEFAKWSKDILVYDCTSNVKKAIRVKHFRTVQESEEGGVCLCTYGLISKNIDLVLTHDQEKITRDKRGRVTHVTHKYIWDYTILDEGHKIKGHSNTTKNMGMINDNHRVIMTGTPIMNKIEDMWYLFNWTLKGKLLGSKKNFMDNLGRHVMKAREKNAFMSEKRHGLNCTIKLKNLIGPYYLQRTKKNVGLENKAFVNAAYTEVTETDGNESKQNIRALKRAEAINESNDEQGEKELTKAEQDTQRNVDKSLKGTTLSERLFLKKHQLSPKTDLVLWTKMRPLQLDLYQKLLYSEQIRDIISSDSETGHGLGAVHWLTRLKQICDHPTLLSIKACEFLGIPHHAHLEVEDNAWLIEQSGKMGLTTQLLEMNKHRKTLFFTRSKRILNIVENYIKTSLQIPYLRLDGGVTRPDARKKIVNEFNGTPDIKVLLMTTQVGGVGLTLTSADRVIVFDPSWTPSDDQQAIDRAHRIGQKNHVVIYRLMTCGTVEEKMFRRQVWKTSIIQTCQSQNTNDAVSYFSHESDVSELFHLGITHASESAQLLRDVHGEETLHESAPAWLRKHVDNLSENFTENLVDVSMHNQMFSLTEKEISLLAKKQQEKMQAKAQNPGKHLGLEKLTETPISW